MLMRFAFAPKGGRVNIRPRRGPSRQGQSAGGAPRHALPAVGVARRCSRRFQPTAPRISSVRPRMGLYDVSGFWDQHVGSDQAPSFATEPAEAWFGLSPENQQAHAKCGRSKTHFVPERAGLFHGKRAMR